MVATLKFLVYKCVLRSTCTEINVNAVDKRRVPRKIRKKKRLKTLTEFRRKIVRVRYNLLINNFAQSMFNYFFFRCRVGSKISKF